MLFKNKDVSKGYKTLQKKSNYFLLDKIKKLIIYQINIQDDYFLNKFFKNKKIYEISLKQFIIQKILNVFFNYEITKSLTYDKKFSYGLPREILRIYEDELIKINYFSSKLKLIKFTTFEFIKGINYFLKVILKKRLFEKDKDFYKKFFFYSFSKVSVRSKLNLERSGLFEWFIKNNKESFLNKKILLSHSDKNEKKLSYKNFDIQYKDHFPIPFLNFKNFLLFVYNFFILFFINFKDILFFNWKSSLLFSQKIIYLNFYYGNPKEIYSEYFFNNSERLYRPLWSYVAEEKGSNITMVYYSLNDIPMGDLSKHKIEKNFYRLAHHHEIMTWPRYYAWNNDHKNYLNYVLNENYRKEVMVKGYFTIHTGKKFNPSTSGKIISCFPINPVDEVTNIINQFPYNYYTYENCKAYVKNILDYFDQLNIKVYFKLKRNFNYQTCEKYKFFFLDLLSKNKFINLDPETDIEDIIEKSDLTISAPFTSVSIISKIKGKNTVYYDPTGTLNKPNHNKAAYNVPIIFDLKTINLNDI